MLNSFKINNRCCNRFPLPHNDLQQQILLPIKKFTKNFLQLVNFKAVSPNHLSIRESLSFVCSLLCFEHILGVSCFTPSISQSISLPNTSTASPKNLTIWFGSPLHINILGLSFQSWHYTGSPEVDSLAPSTVGL